MTQTNRKTNSKHSHGQINKRTLSSMSLFALVVASSKRTHYSAYVRALSVSSSRISPRVQTSGALLKGIGTTPLLDDGAMIKKPGMLMNGRFSKFLSSSSTSESSSTTKLSATVEDDLDSALDEILGAAFQEAGGSSVQSSQKRDIETRTQEDSLDFSDPKVLSTTNPYWVEAGMDQRVIDVLSGKGITKFTEVQAKAFEPILAGRDVIGRSRTGTGKTIAFGLPAVHRLAKFCEAKGNADAYGRKKRGRKVSMITLCPTRELARQVQEEISQIAKPLGLYTTVFHGGVSYDPQVRRCLLCSIVWFGRWFPATIKVMFLYYLCTLRITVGH
jgi:Superfamily II DNA and RNA helicases